MLITIDRLFRASESSSTAVTFVAGSSLEALRPGQPPGAGRGRGIGRGRGSMNGRTGPVGRTGGSFSGRGRGECDLQQHLQRVRVVAMSLS